MVERDEMQQRKLYVPPASVQFENRFGSLMQSRVANFSRINCFGNRWDVGNEQPRNWIVFNF